MCNFAQNVYCQEHAVLGYKLFSLKVSWHSIRENNLNLSHIGVVDKGTLQFRSLALYGSSNVLANKVNALSPNETSQSKIVCSSSGMCRGSWCQECDGDQGCSSGHYCGWDTGKVHNTCKSRKNGGQPCSKDKQCKSNDCKWYGRCKVNLHTKEECKAQNRGRTQSLTSTPPPRFLSRTFC